MKTRNAGSAQAFRGEWCETASGIRFHPEDPRPEMVRIEDIAHHLAQQTRFLGAARRQYSVAEHSILVAEACGQLGCPPAVQLGGLLHDAHEAYLQDIVRPNKPLVGPYYLECAQNLDHVIFNLFEARWAPAIECADHSLCVAEAEVMMPSQAQDWPLRKSFPPAAWMIQELQRRMECPSAWDWQWARQCFLETFRRLREAVEARP